MAMFQLSSSHVDTAGIAAAYSQFLPVHHVTSQATANRARSAQASRRFREQRKEQEQQGQTLLALDLKLKQNEEALKSAKAEIAEMQKTLEDISLHLVQADQATVNYEMVYRQYCWIETGFNNWQGLNSAPYYSLYSSNTYLGLTDIKGGLGGAVFLESAENGILEPRLSPI